MSDPRMNFYQELPYTGSTGYYDPGTPGVGSAPSYMSGSYFYDQAVASLPYLYQSQFITDQQKQALFRAEYKASLGAPWYGSEDQLNNKRALSNLIYSTTQSNSANMAEYNHVIKLPSESKALGLLPPSPYTPPPSGMPADEAALRGEYGEQIANYVPDPYSGSTYLQSYFEAPKIGAQSAYNTWAANQRSLYNTALTDWSAYTTSQNEKAKTASDSESIEFPKPWVPSNPPNFIAGDNPNPEDIDLKPYNPLKSDWNGKVDLSGLAKGLMGLLMGSGGSTNNMQVGSSEYPYFGQVRTQTSQQDQSAKPQDTQALPWQSKNLIKPASYFDDTSTGAVQPKGLMGQEMVTQNNVLPQLAMAMESMKGASAPDDTWAEATKPLDEVGKKLDATDTIRDDAKNKWQSANLKKLANWKSLA